MSPCPRCKWHHDRVTLVEWLWLLRDIKPKPPGVQLGILVMLAARLDPRCGCGWTTNRQIAGDAGVETQRLVGDATFWARSHFLLHRAIRGHHIHDESTGSLWILTRPGGPHPGPPAKHLPAGTQHDLS